MHSRASPLHESGSGGLGEEWAWSVAAVSGRVELVGTFDVFPDEPGRVSILVSCCPHWNVVCDADEATVHEAMRQHMRESHPDDLPAPEDAR